MNLFKIILFQLGGIMQLFTLGTAIQSNAVPFYLGFIAIDSLFLDDHVGWKC